MNFVYYYKINSVFDNEHGSIKHDEWGGIRGGQQHPLRLSITYGERDPNVQNKLTPKDHNLSDPD